MARHHRLREDVLAAAILCARLLSACVGSLRAATHVTDLNETEPFTSSWFPAVEENLWKIVQIEALGRGTYRVLLKTEPCRSSPNEVLGWLKVTDASKAHFKKNDYVMTGVLDNRPAIRFATKDELARYNCLR